MRLDRNKPNLFPLCGNDFQTSLTSLSCMWFYFGFLKESLNFFIMTTKTTPHNERNNLPRSLEFQCDQHPEAETLLMKSLTFRGDFDHFCMEKSSSEYRQILSLEDLWQTVKTRVSKISHFLPLFLLFCAIFFAIFCQQLSDFLLFFLLWLHIFCYSFCPKVLLHNNIIMSISMYHEQF